MSCMYDFSICSIFLFFWSMNELFIFIQFTATNKISWFNRWLVFEMCVKHMMFVCKLFVYFSVNFFFIHLIILCECVYWTHINICHVMLELLMYWMKFNIFCCILIVFDWLSCCYSIFFLSLFEYEIFHSHFMLKMMIIWTNIFVIISKCLLFYFFILYQK